MTEEMLLNDIDLCPTCESIKIGCCKDYYEDNKEIKEK